MTILTWIIVVLGVAEFFVAQFIAFRAFNRAMSAHKRGESIEALQARFRRFGFLSVIGAVIAILAFAASQR